MSAQPATESGQAMVPRNLSSGLFRGISSCSIGVSPETGRVVGGGDQVRRLGPELRGVDEREQAGRLVPAEAGGVLVDFEHRAGERARGHRGAWRGKRWTWTTSCPLSPPDRELSKASVSCMSGLYDRGARPYDSELRGAHLGFPDAGPRLRPVRATDQSRPAVPPGPDPAHDTGHSGRACHGLRHVRGVLDRLALVPLGPLLVGVHHSAVDQDRTVRRLRAPDGGGRRPEHLAGAPAAAAAQRDVPRAAEPRPLPDGHRAVQEVDAARDHRAHRAHRRRLGVRPVADLADVGQRGAVRPEGPPVPPGRLVLRLRPALVPLPARLRLRAPPSCR